MSKKEQQSEVVLHKRRPISKLKKVGLFLLAQLFLAGSILCLIITYNQTSYTAESLYYEYTITDDILDTDVAYEDSNVFKELFRSSISEVLWLAVIKNQLEDRGVFNGKKEIDVCQYAHRRDLGECLDISVKYRLEDLLKWGNSGVEMSDPLYVGLYNYGVSPDQLDMNYKIPEYAYLTDENGDYIPETWMLQPINYATADVLIDDIATDGNDNYYGHIYPLKNKYKTVDGKTIDQLVNNWPDYFELSNDLQRTIDNLLTNYNQYQWTNPYYISGSSNVRYCIRMNSDGKKVYHTNVENMDKLKDSDIDNYFKNSCSRYVYYSPSNLKLETNTSLRDDDLRSILLGSEIDYAYSDDSQIWIGVDASYEADDGFAKARDKFNSKVLPSAALWVISILCATFFVGLMLYLSVKTGWVKGENGEAYIELNGSDEIPLEVFLGIGAVLVIIMWAIFGSFYYNSSTEVDRLLNSLGEYTIPVYALCLFVLACTLGVVYLSFIRRCKSGTLFSNSLIAKACKAVGDKFENASGKHPGSVAILLTFIAFLLVNCVGVIFATILVEYETLVGLIIFGILICINLGIGFYHIKCRSERFDIVAGIERIRNGDTGFKLIPESMHGSNRALADATNHIGEGIHAAVETSMKDEKMKADLITNVSHDIKTPLTSIINYVDLLKRENIQDEKVKGYIKVLDEKSQRLKQLTLDLVEASKISSGTIDYDLKKINLAELINQGIAEFEDKLGEKGLTVMAELQCDNPYIYADSRHMWRIIENLFNNIYKYAMPQTRVYINLKTEDIAHVNYTWVSIKNISAQPLNINADELTERFIRGDVSRSTEGSGLGLSIAKSLTEGQHGKFNIYLDGDLFKVTVAMPTSKENPSS
ncbi:MAG: hypothetical protein IKY04_08565 [Lachnospiraceae bacterium]|nr:hypothetical protein [Lachnospiraceae bacterium]MBR4994285.1 hypothetical protein [Lachnospiraceae bacterium]